MRPAARRSPLHGALLSALLAACLAILDGCAASAPKAPKLAEAPPPAPKPVDPSYDWHGLLPAPFGSTLKQVPLALHEVLLFHDDAQGTASPDDAECYGADSAAPRFVGGTPDEYLVCFKQDRLARIRASVSVDTAKAPEIFATACELWLKNAGQPAPAGTASSATPPGKAAPTENSTPAPTSAPHSNSTCEGLDGAVHFSGRLGEDAAQETPVRIVLDGAPDPKTLSE